MAKDVRAIYAEIDDIRAEMVGRVIDLERSFWAEANGGYIDSLRSDTTEFQGWCLEQLDALLSRLEQVNDDLWDVL